MRMPAGACLFTSVFLRALAASAQTPAPATLAPESPAAVAPAAPVEPASTSAIPQRLAAVEGQLAGMDESLSATSVAIARLSRIQLSGYIQGRYEWHADSSDTLDATGKSRVTSQFLVRRGRLEVVYEGRNAEYLLQIDAASSGVTLKDAEATFVDTWSPFGFRVTLGQFKWPFGYEILQSSADREMPERSLVIRRLFPGERDRGLRVTARHDRLRFAAALVNGNGIQDPIYGATDQNGFKDVVARLGGDFGALVAGLSGYRGQRLEATLPRPVVTTWTDRDLDGLVTPDELSFSPSSPGGYRRFSILRLGADGQVYLDVRGLGGLALKGEFIYAKDTNLGFNATAADKCLDRTQLGWMVTAVQNIGDYLGAVVRVDSFDPNFSKALDGSCLLAIARGWGDRVDTYAGGVLFYPSGNLKGTFTYEHVAEQVSAIKNDVFTAQLQARF